jgi:hypothetical protein
MPIYFLLQGLQVKLAPFVSEYCINCVYFAQNRNTTIFCFCNTKKRHPKGVGPLITVTADDTCTPQLLYILTYYILYVVAFLLPDRKFVIHPV